MKIFLTGGSGFIGSNFINHALSEGHNIFALKKKESSPKIKLIREPFWINGDLDTDVSKYLKESDCLVHLAAYGVSNGGINKDWSKAIKWNIVSTLNLFENAYECGVRKYLVTGSCFEFGNSGQRYKNIPVDAPLQPITAYASSKAAASIIINAWAIEKKVKLHLMRLFHVFGEGEANYRLWASLKNAAICKEDFKMTKGEQVRDFINVKEVSKILLNGICNEILEDGNPLITNVGSGKPTSVLSFCQKWWETFNSKSKLIVGAKPYRDNEIMRYVPEIKSKKFYS